MEIEYPRYFLEPGYIFVSEDPHLIHTVLGSCVAVCLWDVRGRAGGMNHYIFPQSRDKERRAVFGDVSVEHMVRIMKRYGILPKDMRAHIVGGGYNPELGSIIGDQNVETAERILKKHGIAVLNRDIGEATGRKVIFNNLSGEIVVYKNVAVRRTDWYNDKSKEDQGSHRR
ncbi:MAG: chemotaxis protein CheD [Clostridia bacterium]|nr:chemotaxis protein CheD [Clostridia bacterium]